MLRNSKKHCRPWSSIFSQEYIESRRRHELFQEIISAESGSEWIVLDVGGKKTPYKRHFEGRFAEYYAIDLSLEKGVSLISDGHNLAIRDLSADIVVCTQVLEHVKDPFGFVHEIWRVLRPGGRLYLTVPAFYPIHGGPYDAWRFLPDGINFLLGAFSKVTLRSEYGTVGTLFRTLNVYIEMIASRLSWFGIIIYMPLFAISNLIGYTLDRLASAVFPNQQFVNNYFAVAVK
jgi:SAM-dependent methyltransferase